MDRIDDHARHAVHLEFERQRDQPLHFLGGMAGPLRDEFDLRRRKIGIGIHRHALERQDPADRDETGQHQHQEPLAQRGLDDAMDHASCGAPFDFNRSSINLALQRVGELQKQAAVPDHPVAGLQPAGNLGLSLLAFPKRHRTSPELVGRYLGIDERLIFAIAQDRGIRHRQRVLIFPACTVAVTYMSFFSFRPGFTVSMRACRVRVFGIEGRRDIGNRPRKISG